MYRTFVALAIGILNFGFAQAQSDTVKAFINKTLNYQMPLINNFEVSFSLSEMGVNAPSVFQGRVKGTESVEELKAMLQDSLEDAVIFSAIGSAFDAAVQIDSAQYYHVRAYIRGSRLLKKHPSDIRMLTPLVFSALYLNEINAAEVWMQRFQVNDSNESDFLLLRSMLCSYTGCGTALQDDIQKKVSEKRNSQAELNLLALLDFQLDAARSFMYQQKRFPAFEEVLKLKYLDQLQAQGEAEFLRHALRLGYYAIHHYSILASYGEDSLKKSAFLKATAESRDAMTKLMRNSNFNNKVTAEYFIGTSLLSEGEYRKARKHLERSIKNTPVSIGNGMLYNNEKAYNNLFYCYLMDADTSAALDLLDRKLEMKPAGVAELDDILDKATLHYIQGRTESASVLLKQVMDKTDRKFEAWTLQAVINRKLVGAKTGLADLEKAYEINNQRADIFLLLSLFYADLGDRETALRFAKRVYDSQPGNSMAVQVVTMLYYW
ncbi:MAG: hypothetical protein EP332_01940 [Bacteroidetes bacterium]|nr:MAG: hypothetical protein EP332_01940 [Bacteroidota bacterium]